jgi:transcriptional repressor NrdR
MNCPKCTSPDTKVLDSRLTRKGRAVRRRRECIVCHYRYSTLEETRILDLGVEKRNGRIVPFHEQKLEDGIRKAFNKRSIDSEKIDSIVQKVIDEVIKADKNPIKSTRIGQLVLKVLKKEDEAAYICFWAMFGDFETAEEFSRLLQEFGE